MTIKKTKIPSSHETTLAIFWHFAALARSSAFIALDIFSSDLFFFSFLFFYDYIVLYKALSFKCYFNSTHNYSCAECHTFTVWPLVSAIVNPTGIEILIRMPTCRQGFFDSELFIPISFTFCISFFEMDKSRLFFLFLIPALLSDCGDKMFSLEGRHQ
jgi:hypothetical protein